MYEEGRDGMGLSEWEVLSAVDEEEKLAQACEDEDDEERRLVS